MKRILVMTDFSVNAAHATRYAFKLASQLQLDILLCHYVCAAKLEAAGHEPDLPGEGWQEREMAVLQQLRELKNSVYRLRDTVPAGRYLPEVNYHYHKQICYPDAAKPESGDAVQLAVVGTHDATDPKQTENHVNELIELLPYPVMIISPATNFKPFKKILFGTKLQEDEIPLLRHLATLVKPFGAEITLTHICSAHKIHAGLAQKFMADVAHKIPYTHITYAETLQNQPFDIQKVGRERQFDLVLVVHRNHFPSVVTPSFDSLNTPLLVYKQQG